MGDIKMFSTEITNVSSTLLMTVYCHAFGSRAEKPILSDPKAEMIVDQINDELKKLPSKLAKNLSSGKIRKDLWMHIVIRAKQYDKYAKEFLSENPDGVVVNLGCGFDSRFHRIDNGQVHFYDLDLPEVIEIKKRLLPEEDRYKYIGQSVLDFQWMEEVKKHNKPVLFIAEGLFMYLPQKEVESLVKKLSEDFKGGILVSEVVNKKYTVGFNRKIVEFKMNMELKFGDKVNFNCGVVDSHEMEGWGDTVKLIDDWVYFDTDEDIGWMKMFRNIKMFRTTQWTVRYRL